MKKTTAVEQSNHNRESKMTTKRVYFAAWGVRSGYKVPKYAMMGPDEDPAYRIARAIARKNGMEVVNIQGDGYDVDRAGRVTSRHYQITIGFRCPGGGWDPRTQMWFAVDVD